MEIRDNYNRANKVITTLPPKIITVIKTKINCTTIKKILTLQLYKRVIMQKSNSTEEQPKEKKKKLPQHTDEGSLGGKTGFDFFRYFTFLFLNISILRKYIMKNCKLRFVFPNSLNLYILDLQAMKILIRLMLHTKMDLNLHLVKRSSRAVNFFECFRDGNLLDKSCCYWFTYSKSFF